MSAFTIFIVTAIGNAVLAACAAVRVVFACADGQPFCAFGWAIFSLGYAILAVAFALRAASL